MEPKPPVSIDMKPPFCPRPALFLILATTLFGCCPILAQQRPNILLIFSDDQGWNDVSCYGSEIPTPNIDSIAREGLKLNQFYAASSICTPSRYGLFTGRFPTRSQDQLLSALMFLAEEDAERGIRRGESTYVATLAEAGYRTALVGKWHLGHGAPRFSPLEHGFQSFFGHTGGCVDFFTLHYGTKPDWYRDRSVVVTEPPAKGSTYATEEITAEAVRLIESHKGERPLYLHVAYNAPHFGKKGNFETGEIVNAMQPRAEDLAKVPSRITDELRRSFAAKVIGMDEGIGRMLQALKQKGIEDNTLVIFMTDHGGAPDYGGSNTPLRGGKATLFDGGLKVPCVIKWPAEIAAGIESDDVICAIDIAPTLCNVAEAEASQEYDGIDFLQRIKRPHSNRDLGKDRILVWQTGTHAELERKCWLALREGDWKLVDSPTDPPMLFDLANDPNEQHDLASAMPLQLDRILTKAKNLVHSHRP